jgi:hypothetical protein
MSETLRCSEEKGFVLRPSQFPAKENFQKQIKLFEKRED